MTAAAIAFSAPFHGATLRRRRFALFQVTETAYPADLCIPLHAHAAAYLGITVRGAAIQWCGRTEREAKAWALTWHPAGEIHQDRFGNSGAVGLSVELRPELVLRLGEAGADLSRGLHLCDGQSASLGARFFEEFRRDDDLCGLALEGILLETLTSQQRRRLGAENTPPSWLLRVRQLIRERAHEHWTLCSLAAAAEVHPVHFSRSFRRFQRCSIASFIRRARIERACDALQSGRGSLGEIAVACGFCDQSQFSKAFKTETGLTPRQYQLLARR